MSEKLYAERDIVEQGDYYSRHTSAMTGEGLHSKSDIAAELAHRDIEIARLQSEVERLRGRCGDIEDFCADKIGRLPIPHDRTDFANGRYTAFHEVYVEVQRLRQQADEVSDGT